MQRGPSPEAAVEFERELAELLRQVGREITEFAYNQVEPERNEQLPHYLAYEAGQYRRVNRKTLNREVATLFGKITLRRHQQIQTPSFVQNEFGLGLAPKPPIGQNSTARTAPKKGVCNSQQFSAGKQKTMIYMPHEFLSDRAARKGPKPRPACRIAGGGSLSRCVKSAAYRATIGHKTACFAPPKPLARVIRE